MVELSDPPPHPTAYNAAETLLSLLGMNLVAMVS